MSKAFRYLKQIDKKRSASSAALSPLGRVAPPTKPVYVAPVPIPTIDWAETRADPAQALRDAFQTMKDYDFRKDRNFVIVPEKCLSFYKKNMRVSSAREPVYVAPVPISTTSWAEVCSTGPVQDLGDAFQMMREYDPQVDYDNRQKFLEYVDKRFARSK